MRTHLSKCLTPLFVAACCLLVSCEGETEAELMASARSYLAKKQRPAAAIELKKVLTRNASSAEARLLLGQLLIDDGDPAAAEIELRKSLELGGNQAEVAPSLAQAMLSLGQSGKVVSQFGAMNLQDPAAHAKLRTTVAGAHAQQGDLDAAKRELENALRTQPGNAAAMMVQARIQAGEGDVDGALARLDKVIAADPGNEHAGVAKGYLLWLGRKDGPAALAAHRKVLEANPGSVAARAEMVTILFRQGQVADARREFETLREKAPRHPETVFFEAQFAYLDKQYGRVRELTEVLLKLAPDHMRALELAAAAEYQLGNDGQVLAFVSRALKVNPKLVLARQILAQSLLRSGQAAKAVEVLGPLLSGTTADADSLAMAGGAYLQLGDARRADAAFKQAAKLAPGSAKVRTQVAMAMLGSGRSDLALRELESVAASDSGTRADLALISSLIAKQDGPAALKAIDSLARKLPKQSLPDQLRGQVQIATRDGAGARRSFNAALEKDATYFPAVAALASLDVVERKFDAARERVTKYIAKVPNRATPHLLMADIVETAGAGPAEVVRNLNEAVRADPTDGGARLTLINRLQQYGDSRAALAAAQAAAAALPDQAPVAVALVRAQLAAGDAQQAAVSMRKLATTAAPSVDVQMALAEAELNRQDAPAAARALKRALEIDPTHAAARRALAMLAASDKRYDEGLTMARGMQKSPDSRALGHMTEGDIESQRRNWVAAAAAYKRTLEFSAVSEVAIKEHQALVAAGKAAEADRAATEWERKHPEDVLFHFYRGDAATRADRPVDAEAHYRRVLAVQPNNALAMNNVAWLMHKQSKPGALELALKASQLMPNRAPILDTLATIQAANGQVQEAIKTQQMAITAAPDDTGLKLGLARYMVQAGQNSEARTQLEALARLGDRFPRQSEVAALLKKL